MSPDEPNRLPAPQLPPWLSAELPFERSVLELEGQRVHLMESGAGRPVLLLHGNPTWGFLYRKVARALTGEPLRLVMPDLVGLGYSSKPRRADWHTLENHARVVRSLVDALALDGLVFVGQDWGGPIGLRALADRAERVAGLVLLNTGVTPPKPDFRPTPFHRFSHAPLLSDLVFRLLGFPQNQLHRTQGNVQSIRGRTARAYRHPLRRVRDRVAPLALARMVPDSLEHPSVEGLRRCQQFVESFDGPAAIVWGERDPILGRLLRRTQRLLPQASVRATAAGHFLQEEVPEEIAAAVLEVVAAIDAGPANMARPPDEH